MELTSDDIIYWFISIFVATDLTFLIVDDVILNDNGSVYWY